MTISGAVKTVQWKRYSWVCFIAYLDCSVGRRGRCARPSLRL